MPDFNNGESFPDRELGDRARTPQMKVAPVAGETALTGTIQAATPAEKSASEPVVQPANDPLKVAYHVQQYGGGSVVVYEGTW